MSDAPQPVREHDIDVVALSLARAFANDPMLRAGLRPDVSVDELSQIVRALFVEYVAVDAAWQLDGGRAAAGWLPPTAAAAFELIDQRTRPIVLPLTDDESAVYNAFWEWITEHIPDEPVWLLDFIGVDPDVQGRGYGGRLIQHGLDLARDQALPAFLETANPANVAYYEGFGFRVVDSGLPPGGGPEVWFLRHDG